jgi:hypothetical protein
MRSTWSTVDGKPCTEGFGNRNIRTSTLRPPARAVRCIFSLSDTLIYLPGKEAGAVSVFFWRRGYRRIGGGTRVLERAADSRGATLGKGTRSTSTNALGVKHTYPRGCCVPLLARRTAAARGAARSGSVDFRSAAAGKSMYGGLSRPYSAPFRPEPRSHFPTQPLPRRYPPSIGVPKAVCKGNRETHMPNRRPLGSANRKTRVRAVLYGSTGAINS